MRFIKSTKVKACTSSCAGLCSWQLCKAPAFWWSIQCDSEAIAAAPTQAWRWLPRDATHKRAEEKMQLENLQNDPVLLCSTCPRWSLRLLCCTKGRRKGQHLLQLIFPEGSQACLKAPEAVFTSPTLMGHSKAFLNVYKTLRWVPSSRSQLCHLPMFLLSSLAKPFL